MYVFFFIGIKYYSLVNCNEEVVGDEGTKLYLQTMNKDKKFNWYKIIMSSKEQN